MSSPCPNCGSSGGGGLNPPPGFPAHLVSLTNTDSMNRRLEALNAGIADMSAMDLDWVEPLFVSPVVEKL